MAGENDVQVRNKVSAIRARHGFFVKLYKQSDLTSEDLETVSTLVEELTVKAIPWLCDQIEERLGAG